MKDPYVLEFVGLPAYPDHKEKELEAALVDKMQDFLLELGKGFSFIKLHSGKRPIRFVWWPMRCPHTENLRILRTGYTEL